MWSARRVQIATSGVEHPLRAVEGVASVVHDVRQAESAGGQSPSSMHLHVGVDQIGSDSPGDLSHRRRSACDAPAGSSGDRRRQTAAQDGERREVNT